MSKCPEQIAESPRSEGIDRRGAESNCCSSAEHLVNVRSPERLAAFRARLAAALEPYRGAA